MSWSGTASRCCGTPWPGGVTRFDADRGVDNAAALPTPPQQPKRTINALHEPDNLTRQLQSRRQQVARLGSPHLLP